MAALQERCVFHSEADFQHHLAWHIHNELGHGEIRLEHPFLKSDSNHREYCDIVLKSPSRIGIELKYKTRSMSININGECFELKNQAAQDLGRYDFLKDVSRLKRWCIENRIGSGYAILLTNDRSYWTCPKKTNTADKDFRIHNRTVSGKLAWGSGASAGTTKGREARIVLHDKYDLEWKDTPRHDFKYLLLKINSKLSWT